MATCRSLSEQKLHDDSWGRAVRCPGQNRKPEVETGSARVLDRPKLRFWQRSHYICQTHQGNYLTSAEEGVFRRIPSDRFFYAAHRLRVIWGVCEGFAGTPEQSFWGVSQVLVGFLGGSVWLFATKSRKIDRAKKRRPCGGDSNYCNKTSRSESWMTMRDSGRSASAATLWEAAPGHWRIPKIMQRYLDQSRSRLPF